MGGGGEDLFDDVYHFLFCYTTTPVYLCNELYKKRVLISLLYFQCTLNVDSVEVGTYITALQIEDFNPLNISYSSIPLQFTIDVYNSTTPCAEQPRVSSSQADGSEVFIEAKCKWTHNFLAKSSVNR